MNATQAVNALSRLNDAGLTVDLMPDGGLKVTPASGLNEELRTLIRQCKPVLVDHLLCEAANDGALVQGFDRWCWPNSPMWNQREIDTFLTRQARLTDKGISLDDADAFGEKLVQRDRENDDRVLCLECRHLNGYGRRWRCGNWKRADMPPETLAHDFVTQLQRCPGFMRAVAMPDGASTEAISLGVDDDK